MDGKQFRARIILVTMGMLIVLTGSAFASNPGLILRASLDTPPGPDRYASILVDYIEYTWWMARYDDR